METDDQNRVHDLYIQAKDLSPEQRRVLIEQIAHTLMSHVDGYSIPMAVRRVVDKEATVEEAAATYGLDVARLWAELAKLRGADPRSEQHPVVRGAGSTEVEPADAEWRGLNWVAARTEQQQVSFRRARTAAVGLMELIRLVNEHLGPVDLERLWPRFRFLQGEIQAIERNMCHVCGVALPFDLAGIEAYYASERYKNVCADCYRDFNPTEPTARRRLARLRVFAAERPDLVAAKLVVAQERLGLNDHDFEHYLETDRLRLLRLSLCIWPEDPLEEKAMQMLAQESTCPISGIKRLFQILYT